MRAVGAHQQLALISCRSCPIFCLFTTERLYLVAAKDYAWPGAIGARRFLSSANYIVRHPSFSSYSSSCLWVCMHRQMLVYGLCIGYNKFLNRICIFIREFTQSIM